MERLIMVVIVCLMMTVATVVNYPDAVEGAHVLYNDLFGEE